MARKFKRTRRTRRFRGRRMRRYRKAKPAIASVGLPNSMRVNHVYSEAVYHNPASYTTGYLWKINSLYDPNGSGAGGQPALYDNMVSLYRRYRVLGAKVKTEFFNTTADSVIISIMYQGTYSSLISDPNTYFPEGRKGNKIFTLDRVGTGNANKTVTAYFSLPRLEGSNVRSSVNYAGVNADPNTVLYASINMQSVSGSNVTVYTRTTITYYSKWDSPHQYENLLED